MRDGDMNCEAIQLAARQGRELTAYEAAHLDECDACLDVWLTAALDEKPEVAIPEDFAARVGLLASARPEKPAKAKTSRHWGVMSAVAVVTVMLVVCFEGPAPANSTANSWIGPVFLFLVTAEIAGLALWLGPKWMGR